MTNLNGTVERINLLKPIPALATQIMTKSENPDSSLAEIADLIVKDPALTVNLLKIYNSAYDGLPRKVESEKRKNKQDRRKSVRDGVIVSLSFKNDRRVRKDRRRKI